MESENYWIKIIKHYTKDSSNKINMMGSGYWNYQNRMIEIKFIKEHFYVVWNMDMELRCSKMAINTKGNTKMKSLMARESIHGRMVMYTKELFLKVWEQDRVNGCLQNRMAIHMLGCI